MQIETACSSLSLGFRERKKNVGPNTWQVTKVWERVAAKSVQLTSVEIWDFLSAEDPALSLNIDSVFGPVG